MKQAIVVVGFGVGDAQVKERCIDSLLEDLSRSFGEDYDIYEAWTSDFLRRKMAKEGYIYPNLAGVLEDLKAQNYKRVAVMPTHLTPGEEWQKKRSVLSTGLYGTGADRSFPRGICFYSRGYSGFFPAGGFDSWRRAGVDGTRFSSLSQSSI